MMTSGFVFLYTGCIEQEDLPGWPPDFGVRLFKYSANNPAPEWMLLGYQ